jgi:hypothetical protein
VSCARCRGWREAPSDEACGSSRRGELRVPGWSSNDASSEPRRPVLEGVGASWSVYRGGGIVMHTNARFMAGSAWRYAARIRACSGRAGICDRPLALYGW